MKVEEALSKAGSWGKYQKYLVILVFLSGIPNGMISMHFLISNFKPEYRCKLSGEENYLNKTEGLHQFVSKHAVVTVNESGDTKRDGCRFVDGNWSQIANDMANFSFTNGSVKHTKKCENGYVYKMSPRQRSAVTEFSMICDDDWLVPLAMSLYQVGNGGGALLTSLGDKFGRRPTYRLSCVLHVAAGIAVAVSWNAYAYCVLNFFCGLFAQFNYLMAFVIAAELTDTSKRHLMTIYSFISYTIGYCLVAPIGYLQQDWRYCLGIICGLSALIYTPTFCFMPETLGWLAEKGHTKDARKLLLKIAKRNGRLDSIEKLAETTEIIKEKKLTSVGIFKNLKILLATGIGMRYITIGSAWLAETVVYYAISWFSSSFSSDRFLNILYGGLSEFPANFIAYHAVGIIGRPRSLFIFMMICGVSSISLPFVPTGYTAVNSVLSVLGKIAISAAFFTSYLQSSELAPTLQRSTCISFCAAFSRIGAILAPYIMYLGNTVKLLPSTILSAVAVMSGILTIIYLPETRGIAIPDNIEQAKANKRIYGLHILKKFDPSKEADVEPQQKKINHM